MSNSNKNKKTVDPGNVLNIPFPHMSKLVIFFLTFIINPIVIMFQCFVTIGVCLNMAAHGLVMGFNAILLPQLRKPDSIIPIDDSSGSWIG